MAQISATQKDINIDQIQAKKWIAEAQEEIDEVKVILNNASKALSEYPEKDTLLEQFGELGLKLKDTWDEACKGIKTASEYVSDTVTDIGNAIGDVLDGLGELGKKLKL